ncbi:MAG: hypothetical protein IT225_00105 [Flavobacteriales bacterium]|jgi:hypothetical protein|nr:hypothetical protein [Flavobacteriales bacterium]
MTRTITLFLATGMILSSHAQGWQALGLTNIPNESSTCVGAHQGVLYASNFTNGLHKSYDNGDTWIPVPVSGITGWIKGFASTGNRLYTYSQDGSASGYIYWSTDEGATWTVDTVGLPPHAWIPGGKAAVGELHGYNGHLAVIVDQADAYLVKAETDAAWQHVPWLNANDPGSFWSVGDTLIVHGAGAQSAGFAYSTDHGQTWVTPACAGLPSWYSGAVLTHDPLTGRIYSAGNSSIALGSKLHYSDDWGATWTEVVLSSTLTIGNSAWEFSHHILAMLMRGDQIWISCENSAANTRPDLFHSADGGATFERDTVGLPMDQYGTYVMYGLMEKDGDVFCVANLNDVFRRDLGSTGITERAKLPELAVWPNPATDRVQVQLIGGGAQHYQVRDAVGRLVMQGRLPLDGSISIASLRVGAYELQVLKEGKPIGRQRLVKL